MIRLLPIALLLACGPASEDTAWVTSTETTTSSSTTLAETEPPGLDISSDLRAIRNLRDVPSLAAAIVSPTEVLATGANGKRRDGESTKVTWEDAYHLGSVTKVFTAMLVARLADAGSIRWDHAIRDTFPNADPAWEGVTIEMLLRHEGGTTGSIPETHDDLWYDLFVAGDTDVMAARADFAAGLLATPTTQDPGLPVYSNAGYILVGAILEAELDTSWEALLQAEVLDPLELWGCGFGPPQMPTPDDQPWGHQDAGGVLVSMDPTDPYADNPPAIGPAGTLHCPMVDWGRCPQAHLIAANGDTTFLSTDSATRLQTSNGTEFTAGMGWVEGQPWANGPALAMSGSNTMWFATMWIAPGIDRAYVTATNAGNINATLATNDAVLLALELGL